MKTHRLLLLAFFFLPMSPGSAKDHQPDIQEVNAHRDKYDNQRLELRGYLIIGPESMYLVKRPGYDQDYWARDSGCLSLLNTGDLGEKENLYNGKYVKVRGLFRANNNSYGVSLSECGLTGLDIDGSPEENITIEARKPRATKAGG